MSKFFVLNEGVADRIIRIAVGAGLLSLTFFGPKTLWGLLGAVPLITGLAGTCPLYSLVGIKTCATNPTSATES